MIRPKLSAFGFRSLTNLSSLPFILELSILIFDNFTFFGGLKPTTLLSRIKKMEIEKVG